MFKLSITLFLSPSSTLRKLHSFPTRRSSDLTVAATTQAVTETSHALAVAAQQPLQRHLRLHQARSEEHTSELQSRFDLVCRLLLEKKKRHACSSLSKHTPCSSHYH